MSASNWTDCPRCRDRAREQQAVKKENVAALYGRVDQEKYLAAVEAAKAAKDSSWERGTFREDYEQGLLESGIYYISYGGLCVNCGFKHTYRHEERVYPATEGEEYMPMTKEELAARLNGREYGDEIRSDEEERAKQHGLVVIFGASDDCVELRGAIEDEAGAFEGATLYLDEKGLLPDERDDDWMLDYLTRKPAAREVRALWCADSDYSWTIETEIPHATFDVLEDGEPFCRGVVIDLADVG